MSEETIGFIGLGIMGAPMAGHLLRGGHPVVVWNRTHSKMEPLLAQGAQAAASPKDLAARSDVVISMLSDSPDVEQVYLGPDGVLAGVQPGTLLIDMSTISPVTAVQVVKAAAEKGCPMLDAPVSGGDVGARNATLAIMVGGEPEVLERAGSILALLGKPVLCGPSGAGQTVKACNQIATALHIVAMAEALTLGKKAGVDPAIILQVLGGGYAQSRVMDARGLKVIQGDFSPGFRSRLHLKDLNIAQQTARAHGCTLPATSVARELFARMQAEGWGDLDHSAVIRVIEMLSGGAGATREQ
jgi:2-hydroxy-3-oxopropionate reductase